MRYCCFAWVIPRIRSELKQGSIKSLAVDNIERMNLNSSNLAFYVIRTGRSTMNGSGVGYYWIRERTIEKKGKPTKVSKWRQDSCCKHVNLRSRSVNDLNTSPHFLRGTKENSERLLQVDAAQVIQYSLREEELRYIYSAVECMKLEQLRAWPRRLSLNGTTTNRRRAPLTRAPTKITESSPRYVTDRSSA